MGELRSIRRTGRGLSALRERYIRRAEFLCLDADFRSLITAAHNHWLESWPKVAPNDLSTPLSDELRHKWRAQYGPDWPYAIQAAMHDWAAGMHELVLTFFPPWDFHFSLDVSSRIGITPAKFLTECVCCGDPRRLIGNVAEFFPPINIELVMDHTEYDKLEIQPEEWELFLPQQRWYIPVYPGMTAKDLESAIPGIIEQVNYYLSSQTVGARIEDLANVGLSHRRIAETLGVDEKSVSAHLRSARAA